MGRIKLSSHCTVAAFRAIRPTKSHHKNGKTLIVDILSHRVALNNNGHCTVEQFGSLAIAKEKFNLIRSQL